MLVLEGLETRLDYCSNNIASSAKRTFDLETRVDHCKAPNSLIISFSSAARMDFLQRKFITIISIFAY